jgi:hypothetical protein
MRNTEMKTIDDVTTEEWGSLAEAAVDLLNCARFMFWLSGSGAGDKDDTSVRDCLERMASVLESIGLPQGSIEEFESNLEALLKSGKSPEQWVAEHERASGEWAEDASVQ